MKNIKYAIWYSADSSRNIVLDIIWNIVDHYPRVSVIRSSKEPIDYCINDMIRIPIRVTIKNKL